MGIRKIGQYGKIIGSKKLKEIREEAEPLRGKYITHINSTYYVGGVAEILDSLVLLMNDLGIKAEWRLLKGSEPFFKITKLFHNGAQGARVKVDSKIKKIYEEICEKNSVFNHFGKSDLVIAHDPQVLPLIKFCQKIQPWVWRCHMDITEPDKELWKYLKTFINKYDEVIVSDEKYRKSDIKPPQTIIMPSIDPLNEKNRKINEKTAKKVLRELGIKLNKPIISQISRYDFWKDQVGVVRAFEIARKKANCQLILLGNLATDDPEGDGVYKEVLRMAKGKDDIKVILKDDIIIANALQRLSAVVLQKSLREGFALTVSEALWKGTPVIGGNVGGIPNQIIDGQNGYLVNNIKECADRIVELLGNGERRKKMGEFGREYVKENFLITRHLLDYIKLSKRLLGLKN
ncbi:MAG: glycosyltransferase [Patescibacteria group bacterium]|nr:glycosyltransferase [Patescibacteria group bacterium]